MCLRSTNAIVGIHLCRTPHRGHPPPLPVRALGFLRRLLSLLPVRPHRLDPNRKEPRVRLHGYRDLRLEESQPRVRTVGVLVVRREAVVGAPEW